MAQFVTQMSPPDIKQERKHHEHGLSSTTCGSPVSAAPNTPKQHRRYILPSCEQYCACFLRTTDAIFARALAGERSSELATLVHDSLLFGLMAGQVPLELSSEAPCLLWPTSSQPCLDPSHHTGHSAAQCLGNRLVQDGSDASRWYLHVAHRADAGVSSGGYSSVVLPLSYRLSLLMRLMVNWAYNAYTRRMPLQDAHHVYLFRARTGQPLISAEAVSELWRSGILPTVGLDLGRLPISHIRCMPMGGSTTWAMYTAAAEACMEQHMSAAACSIMLGGPCGASAAAGSGPRLGARVHAAQRQLEKWQQDSVRRLYQPKPMKHTSFDLKRMGADAAADADQDVPLATLPTHLLEQILHKAQQGSSAGAIRGTCWWLRSAFDSCNTSLVLGGSQQPPPVRRGSNISASGPEQSQVLDLVLRSPQLTSLDMQPWLTTVSWAGLLEAGRPVLTGRLQRMGLSSRMDVVHLAPIAACTALQHLDLGDCRKLHDLGPLAACTQLRHLDLSGCLEVSDVAPLASCSMLQHLELRGCVNISDLTPLAVLTMLHHLNLLSCCKDGKARDLNFLMGCTSLKHLDLMACSVTDLTPIAACTGLRYLNLAAWMSTVDLTPIACCTALRQLILGGWSCPVDLTPLSACTSLHTLVSSRCQNLTNLAALSAMYATLQHLDLSRCSRLKDLSPLASSTALQHLDLSHCDQVIDVSPLSACTALRRADFSHCCHLADLRALSSASKLQSLCLVGCRNLRTLQPLAACAMLQHLNLDRCDALRDLSPLVACTELCCLNLSGCSRVVSLQPLAACTALQELNLSLCSGVRDVSPLTKCVGLLHLSLEGCRDLDTGTLAACTRLRTVS